MLKNIFIALLFTSACVKKEEPVTIQPFPNPAKGKLMYERHCTACHHINPKYESYGPDLYTTPDDVFYHKVIWGMYPQGYVPKRETRNMPIFKLMLNPDVKNIIAYIRSIR